MKKEIPTIILFIAMFLAGMFIENVRAKSAYTPESNYALCLKVVLKEDGMVDMDDARACGAVAYRLYLEKQ